MIKGTTRVLIVDDSPVMRHLLTEAIGHSTGFKVVPIPVTASEAHAFCEGEPSTELSTREFEP